MIPIELLLVAALAVYRITLIVHKEDGPFELAAKFRTWAGVTYDQYSNPVPNGQLSAAILCPYCLSVWIGICATLYIGLAVYLNIANIAIYPMLPFALSGLSTFLFRWTGV